MLIWIIVCVPILSLSLTHTHILEDRFNHIKSYLPTFACVRTYTHTYIIKSVCMCVHYAWSKNIQWKRMSGHEMKLAKENEEKEKDCTYMRPPSPLTNVIMTTTTTTTSSSSSKIVQQLDCSQSFIANDQSNFYIIDGSIFFFSSILLLLLSLNLSRFIL